MEWKTAIYLRLSRDDGLDGSSESIKNQQAFLEDYAQKNGLQPVTAFTDDGWSGTNFERPAFMELIKAIEVGKINCVITKDLSRLGRDYIMTGHYLERYFPEHGVRYIAVTDGFDTFATGSGNDMSPFKAVFNDMYAKDISKKVRTALTTKREQGQFIGSVAPYGYRKDPQNKNHLVIDEETAIVVRRIFTLALNGVTLLGIANRLSADGVETPSRHKNLTVTQRRWAGVWNDVIVRRILTSETYIGNLVQSRTRKINYKVSKKIALPPSQWIIVEGTHEAIIVREDFQRVQQLLQNSPYANTNRTGGPHLLSGLAYCEDCGAPMSFMKDGPTRSYMVCSTWRKYAKLGLCTSHCIRENLVEDTVKEQLRQLAQQMVNFDDLLEVESYDFLGEKRELQQCRTRLGGVDKTLLSLYKDKVSGVLTEENFVGFSRELGREKQQLMERMTALEVQLKSRGDSEETQRQLKELLSFAELDRATLTTLVKRVVIGKEKEVTIELNFAEPIAP